MSDTLLIAAMGTIIVAVFGVVWGLMRGEITELKAKSVAFEAQMVSLHTSNARAEERDKAFADTMDRLGRSLDRFDTKVDGAGRATLDVTGYRVDDMSKSGTWRIHQRFYRTGGALNLIGAATTEYADVDGAWGFTAPTLAVSGYNLRAAITSHATIATVWAATVVAIEAAP